MKQIQKDHIFTEVYIGIHCLIFLLVSLFCFYSQSANKLIMTLTLIIYGIYIGTELYLFATNRIKLIENLGLGYFQSVMDILFISVCGIYLKNFYLSLLPLFCLFILIFSLRNHRTKSMVHGFIAAVFYIFVSFIFNHSFSTGIIIFQASLILGFSLFVAEVNHLFNDVYERNRYAMVEIEYKNQLLEYRAKTDFLTDLSNHQAFYQSLALIAPKQAPIALILFDIDDFKAVNDKYGHLSGDYVLREVAQIIKKHLRASDIGARYGGEEFAVLLPGTEELFGQLIAKRICAAIAQYQFEFDGQCMTVTVSAGVCNSTATLDRTEQTLLVNRADELLYCSKRNGKNQVTSARFK